MYPSYHATILLLLYRLPNSATSFLAPTTLPLVIDYCSPSRPASPTLTSTTTATFARTPSLRRNSRGWLTARDAGRRGSHDGDRRRIDGTWTVLGQRAEESGRELARQRAIGYALGWVCVMALSPWSAGASAPAVESAVVSGTATPTQIQRHGALATPSNEIRAPSVLDDHLSLLIASSNDASQSKGEENALNEVWTLVDKYYVNKASNRNWNRVRDDYLPRFEQLASRSAPVEEQLKVVEEMVATLGDKYSRILSPSQYADIQKFDLLGVGVTLMPSQGRIVVGAPPIEGSASARAGLKAGDVILAVNGVPTQGRTALDIIDQISEHPDARTLTFLVANRESYSGAASASTSDEAASAGYEVTLDRTLMDVRNPIQYQLNSDGVGYVRISEFNSMVLPKLEEALAALSPSARRGLVLDLRHNTGGAFQSAVEIASRFLRSDTVAIYVVDNTDQTTPFRTAAPSTPTSPLVDPSVPLVIWMDGRTASASEVLAAALHDNCRAVLAGSNSFGKGLIQAVYGLKNGGGLVLTVARYVTPSGSDIQGSGIVPDIQGHVAPTLLGVPVSADTSSVDWDDVRRRLSQCQAPTA